MAKEIAEFLEFDKTRKAIVYHVDVNDKLMFQDFPNNLQQEIQIHHINKGVKCFDPFDNCLKYVHPHTLFISSAGVLALFMKSSKPVAQVMKKWLMLHVLPSILNTGSYSITQDTKESITVLPPPTLPRLMTSNEPEIENLSEYPALSVIHNAIYILECYDNEGYKYLKFGKSDNLMDRLEQHCKRHGTFKIKAVYPCRNPSVIESKLKSELHLKKISKEATGIKSERITELFLPEHFDIVNTIIQQIIEMDLKENDTVLALEMEKTKQKEIEERIEMQRTEQLRLQITLANITQKQPQQQNLKRSQQTLESYYSKK